VVDFTVLATSLEVNFGGPVGDPRFLQWIGRAGPLQDDQARKLLFVGRINRRLVDLLALAPGGHKQERRALMLVRPARV